MELCGTLAGHRDQGTLDYIEGSGLVFAPAAYGTPRLTN